MNIVLLGPPGAGKGTLAGILAGRFKHLSVGDILRRAVKEKTSLGEEAGRYMDAGRLVPDRLIIDLIRSTLSEAPPETGVLFDGFPRTIGQAEALGELLAEAGRALDLVVNIELPEDDVIARLTGRRVCRQCGANYHLLFRAPMTPERCDQCGGPLYQRSDDAEDTVRARLSVYRAQTAPLVAYYAGQGLLVDIDGRGGVEEVAGRLEAVLGRR